MQFAISCLFVRDGHTRRKELRVQHLEYMIGALPYTRFGGGLLDGDGSTAIGMLVVIDVADRREAEAFIAGEPYCRAGLFESIAITRVRQMTPPMEPTVLLQELERELRDRGEARRSPGGAED